MKIKDPKFYGAVKDYLTIYLPSQKESSPNTVKSYREGLNLFLTYIADSERIRIYQVGFKEMVSGTFYPATGMSAGWTRSAAAQVLPLTTVLQLFALFLSILA